MRVGLRTSELGCRAFSSARPNSGRTNNGHQRGNTRDRSVTAAGPFRIHTGFPVRRAWQAAEPGHQHLVTWSNLSGLNWIVSRRQRASLTGIAVTGGNSEIINTRCAERESNGSERRAFAIGVTVIADPEIVKSRRWAQRGSGQPRGKATGNLA
jgi:hypothetical protein